MGGTGQGALRSEAVQRGKPWGGWILDVEGMLTDFKRGGYSSVLAQTAGRAGRDQFQAGLASDPRLALEGKIERAYYDDQTSTAAPIKFLGFFVGIVMAIGACFGAMNTMYAAVAARTREIATLRALGFSRFSVLLSFVFESLCLALLGGALGCVLGLLAVKLALSGVTGHDELRDVLGGRVRLPPHAGAPHDGYRLLARDGILRRALPRRARGLHEDHERPGRQVG